MAIFNNTYYNRRDYTANSFHRHRKVCVYKIMPQRNFLQTSDKLNIQPLLTRFRSIKRLKTFINWFCASSLEYFQSENWFLVIYAHIERNVEKASVYQLVAQVRASSASTASARDSVYCRVATRYYRKSGVPDSSGIVISEVSHPAGE